MIEPFIYKTIARFSDTDSYGVVHHSNYFRWMEEARMQMMEDVLKLSLEELIRDGIQFPVINLEGKYIKSVFARQTVTVIVHIIYDKSTRLVFEYEIHNDEDELVFRGKTVHALTKNHKIIYAMPEEYNNLFQKVMKDFEGKYLIIK